MDLFVWAELCFAITRINLDYTSQMLDVLQGFYKCSTCKMTPFELKFSFLVGSLEGHTCI